MPPRHMLVTVIKNGTIHYMYFTTLKKKMEYAKHHLVLYLEWTNFMVCELYLDKVVQNEKKEK